MLTRLHRFSPNGESTRYAAILPDSDDFELRAAASWLVTNGYARWAASSSIAITGLGVQTVTSTRDLTTRHE